MTEWPLLQPHTTNQSHEGHIGLDLYLVERRFKIQYHVVFVPIYIFYGKSPVCVCVPIKHCFDVETGLIP